MLTVRGKGKISVTYDALKRALRLPDSARIIAVLSEPDGIETETFNVLVEDDDFPLWETGAAVPRAFAMGCLRDEVLDPITYFDKADSLNARVEMWKKETG